MKYFQFIQGGEGYRVLLNEEINKFILEKFRDSERNELANFLADLVKYRGLSEAYG